jgi:glycosyltransferase involved in cell wall biosynthesis
VVTDLPVLREVLSPDGKPAALFVDASDNAALSAAVSRVLDNAPLREALRANAGVLKQHYSLKAMVDAYVELVEAA